MKSMIKTYNIKIYLIKLWKIYRYTELYKYAGHSIVCLKSHHIGGQDKRVMSSRPELYRVTLFQKEKEDSNKRKEGNCYGNNAIQFINLF